MRARDYSPASGRFTANDPVAIPTGMPYVAGYSYTYNNPLIHPNASGMCVGIKGTTQDRRCTYNDYYWYGIPGALGDQFLAAWAGASDGVGFNVPMLLDDSSYNKYSNKSAYWVGDVVGVACSVLTLTATADMRITGSLASRSSTTVNIGAAKFAQKTYTEMFSDGGLLSGRSINDLAAALRSGAMSAKNIPIDVIVRNGNTLILNTRSSQALIRAGIARRLWTVVDRTGRLAYEERLSKQLSQNGLSDTGTDLH